jgi:hypothetical protein
MAELNGGGDPELGEPRDVVLSQELSVLDARAKAARPPLLLRRLERVQGVTVREVADRMHGDGEARARGAADDVLEQVAARDLDSRSVDQSRRARSERPVHERLDVADADEVVAQARMDAQLGERVDALVRERLPHAQREAAFAAKLLPDLERAQPPVLVVDGGDPAGICNAHSFPGGLDHLGERRAHICIAEVPGAFLAEHACGLPVFIPLDDAARDLQVAVGLCQGGRV